MTFSPRTLEPESKVWLDGQLATVISVLSTDEVGTWYIVELPGGELRRKRLTPEEVAGALVPPPKARWQVCYRDGTTQRSGGIYPTKAEARSVKRAVEHGEHVASSDQLSPGRASMLFGEYVTTIWWPARKPSDPRSADDPAASSPPGSCPASATSLWPTWTRTPLPPGSAT